MRIFACVVLLSGMTFAQTLPYSGSTNYNGTAFSLTNTWATAPSGGHALDAIADFVYSRAIYARSNDGYAIEASTYGGIGVMDLMDFLWVTGAAARA